MPRITVITDEKTYKQDYPRFQQDPGACRGPYDLCNECFADVDVETLARVNGISLTFAQEQLDTIAEQEGHMEDFHPDYDDCDYRCQQCGAPLTNDDN